MQIGIIAYLSKLADGINDVGSAMPVSTLQPSQDSSYEQAIGWLSWELKPTIVITILLVCVAYSAGAVRLSATQDRRQIGQNIAFAAGVTSIILAFASPIDAMAGHLFSVQQVQVMLLRMVGPALIVLADPWDTLINGLPNRVGQKFAAAICDSAQPWRFFSTVTHPIAATFLFVATFSVWQIPFCQDSAVLNESVADFMHVTILISGLLFWRRALDTQPLSEESNFASRLAMLFFATVTQIGLGAYLTLKSVVLYPAYDMAGRLFKMQSLADETIGGAIIWVPGSIACVLAAIIVIHLWGKHEERIDARRMKWSGSNSDALLFPTTGAALIEIARPKNRIMAIGAAALAVAIFAMVIISGVLNHINNSVNHSLSFVSPQPERHTSAK